MKRLQGKKGFTLIEVVLTIAIGALIFLLAFIAFRNTQVNRRDAQRRRDADKIMAEISNYKADKGLSAFTLSQPKPSICDPGSSSNDFAMKYLCQDGKFESPSGNNYSTVASNSSTVAQDQVQINFTWVLISTPVPAKACDGTTDLPMGGYVVRVGLEKGVACRESNSS